MVTGESDKEICAVVIKHNLLKEVAFDLSKHQHCKKMGKIFLNRDISYA